MKKFYEKSETWFAIVLIIIYSIGMSLVTDLNKAIGIEYSANIPFLVVLTAVITVFIVKNGLQKKYGLCKAALPASKFLWYIPLLLLVSRNLWLGAVKNLTSWDLVCYLVAMLFIGFIEEILFRGLLFRALEKDNHTLAVIISSVTFGLGHIINMFNGVQDNWLAGILQVIGAIAIGFLFVTLFERCGSLWPCIIAHSGIDMVSAFANEKAVLAHPYLRILLTVSLIVIVGLYILYMNRSLLKKRTPSAESAK